MIYLLFQFNSMISSQVPSAGFGYPGTQPQTGDLSLQGAPPAINPTSLSGGATGTVEQLPPHAMPSGGKITATCRGGIRNAEGPLGGSTNGILASLQQPGGACPPLASLDGRRKYYDDEQLELLSTEMSFSALYLHELHRRRMFQPLFDIVSDPISPDEAAGPDGLLSGPGPWSGQATGPGVNLPHIQEREEEEQHNESQPLLNLYSKPAVS